MTIHCITIKAATLNKKPLGRDFNKHKDEAKKISDNMMRYARNIDEEKTVNNAPLNAIKPGPIIGSSRAVNAKPSAKNKYENTGFTKYQH